MTSPFATNGTSAKLIAVSCGEPSGIGPDVILKSWLRRDSEKLPAFYILGDVAQLTARAKTLGFNIPIRAVQPDAANAVFSDALPVSPLKNELTESIGVPLIENAAGVIEAIDRGVADIAYGAATALVTAPIAKKPLYDAGFRHPGHTEFLAELASKYFGGTSLPVMMIAGPELRTIPVTIHIPISAVPAALTSDAIIETARIAHHDLKNRFGIDAPRLAISGLNPHAGEDGAMGKEDLTIIAPAITALRAEGINAVGPLPADTMFHASARANYDVAICMYHDQALIPAKMLGFDDGVNVTLGLPFIRTSPDHGTAFAIAGTGVAKPYSFMAALKLAAQMGQSIHE